MKVRVKSLDEIIKSMEVRKIDKDSYIIFKNGWSIPPMLQKLAGQVVDVDKRGDGFHYYYFYEFAFHPSWVEISEFKNNDKVLVSTDGKTFHKAYYDRYEDGEHYIYIGRGTKWSSGGESVVCEHVKKWRRNNMKIAIDKKLVDSYKVEVNEKFVENMVETYRVNSVGDFEYISDILKEELPNPKDYRMKLQRLRQFDPWDYYITLYKELEDFYIYNIKFK